MSDKLKIEKLILVEGKYDKIRLENIVDSNIFVLNGFKIFNDTNAIETIKSLADDREILLLTDSDTAGYKIRVYLSKVLSSKKITHVFIPQIKGKEKRKEQCSAEGYLGVEGVSDEILLSVLSKYAVSKIIKDEITTTDLFNLGYMGVSGAKERKNELLRFLGVQTNISNTFLLRILNERFTLNEFKNIKLNFYGDDEND